MSSSRSTSQHEHVVTAPRRPHTDELTERLRHPSEPRALVICIVANLLVVAAVIGIILAGADWLAEHPRLFRRIDEIRVIAIAVVLAVPMTFAGRHVHLHHSRGNGVRITEEAYPELH